MKKLLIFLGFLLAFVAVEAQPTGNDGYRPMLKEGKAWNYIYVKVDIVEIEDGRKVEEETEIPEHFYLKGDTIIGGKKCMKMYLKAQGRDSYDSSWYEEDYKVYRIMKDETEARLIFDFGLQIGERPTFQFGERLSLASTDQIEVNGRRFYRQHFTEMNGEIWEDASICVAGVGGSYDGSGIFNGGVYGILTCICDYSYFVSCEEDGEVIFTKDDFNKEAVEYEILAGQVKDQNGKAVVGATITMPACYYSAETGDYLEKEYVAKTDSEGEYSLTIFNDGYHIGGGEISADGFATYEFKSLPSEVNLFNAVTFKAGVRSTIVLPFTPDPSVGKYYEWGKVEGSDLIFYRELHPKADIPYIFIPNEDYVVSLEGLDLTRELTSIKYLCEVDDGEGYTSMTRSYFIPTYRSILVMTSMSEFPMIIDTTPDCSNKREDGFWGRVGALHAYIARHWQLPADLKIVLSEETGISTVETEKVEKQCKTYDLQGREVTAPQAGRIYIKDGRKFMAR